MVKYERSMLIYNGNAGQGNIESVLEEVVPILTSYFPNIKTIAAQRPNHAMEICEEYGASVDLVIILGGDGTIHECINGLSKIDSRPAIGILPGGTCNDFSRSLKIDQDINMAAEQLVSGEEIPVDVLQVGTNFCLNFWGTGLIAEASNNIQQQEKERLGKFSYFLSAIRTIKDTERFKYEMEIDGKRINGEAVFILVANGNYIGTNLLPFQSIKYNDGLADVFVVKDTNIGLLKELLTMDISIEKNELSKEIDHYAGTSISIFTEKEMHVDMDGELNCKTPSHINVLKHHLHIIKPI